MATRETMPPKILWPCVVPTVRITRKRGDKPTWPLPLLVAFVWFSWQAFPWCFSDIAQLFGKIADNHRFPETGLCLASDPPLPWSSWGGSIYALLCPTSNAVKFWETDRRDERWGPRQLLGTKSEVNGSLWLKRLTGKEQMDTGSHLCRKEECSLKTVWALTRGTSKLRCVKNRGLQRLGLTRSWSTFMLSLKW